MTDWKLAAKALNLPIPEGDLDKVVPPLTNLEAAFQPLADSLTGEDESALIYRLTGDGK